MRFIMTHIITILFIISIVSLAIVNHNQTPDSAKDIIEVNDYSYTNENELSQDRILSDAPSSFQQSRERGKGVAASNGESGFRERNNEIKNEGVEDAGQESNAYKVVRSGEGFARDWQEDDGVTVDSSEGFYESREEEENIEIFNGSQQEVASDVIHIEISGNETVTTIGGVVTQIGNADYGSFDEPIDTSVTLNDEEGSSLVTDEIINTADVDQAENKLPCPNSLYGGGNAYAINMLKKRGCPKPEFYSGPW